MSAMGKIRTFSYSTYIKLIDTRTDMYQKQKLLFFKPSVFLSHLLKYEIKSFVTTLLFLDKYDTDVCQVS